MISSVVLTKNSSATLEKSLKSLKFTGEIIVIDDYSTDNTTKIAKKHGAAIYKRKLNDDFAAQRNYGLSKTKGDWVLFIDSDEVVSDKLAKEIVRALKASDNSTNAYYIPRHDNWMGKKINYGETNTKIIRLARKKAGKWSRPIHEVWKIRGQVVSLKNGIDHYPHATIREFINAIGNYSVLHSVEISREDKRPNLGIINTIVRPFAKFNVNYFIKQGYKDGLYGLVIAGIMSFHSFLSWSQLWLTSRKKK